MPRILYPTETHVPGPWLLDAKQLTELDTVLDQFDERLSEEKNEAIEAEIEDDIQEYLNAGLSAEKIEQIKKRITETVKRRVGADRQHVRIYMPGGKSLSATTFSEALRQPEALDEKSLGFYYSYKIGRVEATIGLTTEWLSEANLKVSVEPNSSNIARELFGALQNWAGDIQAQPWIRWWLKARGVFRFLFFMWVWLGLVLLIGASAESSKQAYKQQAHQLLETGVKQDNLARAVELLLAIDSEYSQSGSWKIPGWDYWRYYITGILVLASLSLCPKICLGVWRGKRALLWWRIWLKLVWVTIPSTIILPRLIHAIF